MRLQTVILFYFLYNYAKRFVCVIIMFLLLHIFHSRSLFLLVVQYNIQEFHYDLKSNLKDLNNLKFNQIPLSFI